MAEEAGELPEHVRQLYEDSSKDLTSQQCETLTKLLGEYNDIFARHSADFGRTKLLKHDIDTGNKPTLSTTKRRGAEEADHWYGREAYYTPQHLQLGVECVTREKEGWYLQNVY